MHFLQVLLHLSSFILATHAFAIDRRGCVSSDVALLKQQVTHPEYLCTWYLSEGRTQSPVPGIGADAVLNACNCIIDASPSGTSSRITKEIASAARSFSFTYGTCPAAAYTFISKEYKNSAAFCTFWGYWLRVDSPIPNQNNPSIRHACDCILANLKSTSKSPSSSPLSTKTTRSSAKTTSKILTTESSSRRSSTSSATSRSSSKKTLTSLAISGSKRFSSSISSNSKKPSSSSSSGSKKATSAASSSSVKTIASSSSAKSSSSASSSAKTPTVTTRPNSKPNSTPGSKSSSYGVSSPSSSSLSSIKISSSTTSQGPSTSNHLTSISSSLTSSSNRVTSSSALSPSIRPSSSRSIVSTSTFVNVPTSTIDIYDVITSSGLQAFCTTLLGYSSPLVTATQTNIYSTAVTTTSIITEIETSTETDYTTITTSSSTVAAVQRRKRDNLATPFALAGYANSALSSGCSRAIAPPETSTVTLHLNLTATSTINVMSTTTATLVVTSTSTTLVSPSPVNLLMNGDFNTADLTGWTINSVGAGNQAYVGTSGSSTGSPHMIWSFSTVSPAILYQNVSGITSNSTWYKMTMDYMMESVGPFSSGSTCYLVGKTGSDLFFQQYAPNTNYFSNQDASNQCSTTLIDQPVPGAGQWSTVTAYLQFHDATEHDIMSFEEVDSGYIDSMIYFITDCGQNIQNTIHMDNLVLQVATECS